MLNLERFDGGTARKVWKNGIYQKPRNFPILFEPIFPQDPHDLFFYPLYFTICDLFDSLWPSFITSSFQTLSTALKKKQEYLFALVCHCHDNKREFRFGLPFGDLDLIHHNMKVLKYILHINQDSIWNANVKVMNKQTFSGCSMSPESSITSKT